MRSLIGTARFAAVFVFVLCCLVIIFCVFPLSGEKTRGRIIRSWSARLLRWLGVRLVIEGGRQQEAVHDCGITPDAVGRLVVSNHISAIDIFALNAVIPCAFVAKAEIAKWPVFGMIAKAAGTIFIERGNKRALVGIGNNMQQALRQGRSLLVFPEGTTSDGTKLLKLHGNLMESAVRTGAPVLPVVLEYKVGGKRTTLASYVGDTGLFECLWKVVTAPDLTIEARILNPLTAEDRHTLCRLASADMAASLGVADPLAPAPAASEQHG
ncbi:MAG: lysophospholipid acyltransferase family protein [Duodenibacillus sp.]